MTRFRNLIFVLALIVCAPVFSQCFQIESILVDACGPQEGLNEMVRFKVGNAAINTSALSVTWPNNPWEGLIQNAVTAQKVAALNADIVSAGGCGQLIEPAGGLLPANATVILVTSYQMDTASNQFGPVTENIYIIFQDNPSTTSGHFANFGTGLRTLMMAFGSCSDTVTYDRSLLTDENGVNTAGDGATVLFAPDGTPTYVNYGCTAPVPPFAADAGVATLSVCPGATVNLHATALGQTSVAWSASSGSFSNPTSLNTAYTVPANASGTITLTFTATNSCGATVSDDVILTVSAGVVPNFPTSQTICSGSAAPFLPNISPNGVTGTWSPSSVSNLASGVYVFTPDPGQCASPLTFSVTVTDSVTPDFAAQLTICKYSVAPALMTTSPNGITGSWNPSAIDSITGGVYVFVPDPGQCASNAVLLVNINTPVTPDFPSQLTICSGGMPPLLATVSPNGITGSWTPPVISNSVAGAYMFIPDAGQCASGFTLTVSLTSAIVPDFPTHYALCSGTEAPVLESVSPSGISGTWSPAVIDNQADGTYVFTPDAGQCAAPFTLTTTIDNISAVVTQGCRSGFYVVHAEIGSQNGYTLTWTDAAMNVLGNAADLDLTTLASQTPLVFPMTLHLEVVGESGCLYEQMVSVGGILCTIQKGISPNGDGLNDSFDLSGFDIRELRIYNRYGTKVYSRSSYVDQWNGQTDKGQELPDGTYYYALTTSDGVTKTGWIYINRKT